MHRLDSVVVEFAQFAGGLTGWSRLIVVYPFSSRLFAIGG